MCATLTRMKRLLAAVLLIILVPPVAFIVYSAITAGSACHAFEPRWFVAPLGAVLLLGMALALVASSPVLRSGQFHRVATGTAIAVLCMLEIAVSLFFLLVITLCSTPGAY